ncbi:MAG: 4-hydroxybenzoate 3-monooxygenase [Maricaulaceae bacterium]
MPQNVTTGSERTQVAIVGSGPAGLLLAQLLHQAGVDCVVLERRSRDYVEGRIRAGVLEQGTVALVERAGVAARMHAEGLIHDGFSISVDGESFRIDLKGLTGGAGVMVYGQTELTRDLIDALVADGRSPVFEAEDVAVHDIASDAPYVTYVTDGQARRLDCDFIAGCDGFHGVCRASIPVDALNTYERVYPFGWLGVLADAPPCDDELIYSSHARGFALSSMRSPSRVRCYIQAPLDTNLDEWPDERFWDEFAARIGPPHAEKIVRAPSIEKSIAPLRSFVAEPMRHGRLFLAGDAAHIVPPTGAKGLNLAASDVGFLSDALIAFYCDGDAAALDQYSERALARVWMAERFSWWMTTLTHRFDDAEPWDRKMQRAEIDYLRRSRAAQTALAENYVGLGLSA